MVSFIQLKCLSREARHELFVYGGQFKLSELSAVQSIRGTVSLTVRPSCQKKCHYWMLTNARHIAQFVKTVNLLQQLGRDTRESSSCVYKREVDYAAVKL